MNGSVALPKPFYQDELAAIYSGDALEVLSALRSAAGSITDSASLCDAVVTDPPYSSGARTESSKAARDGGMTRGHRWSNRPIDTDQMTTPGFVWLVRQTAVAVRPLLADGGSLFSFIDWRQWPNLLGAVESANYRINKMIVWDKENFGMGNGFRNQHELILFASKGVPNIAESDTPDVLRFKREENLWHPSPKPVALMEALLRVVVPSGGTVLDPYMGAGATLVAARRLGIRAIGIECDATHCRTAADRLRAEINGSTIEASRAGQCALFSTGVEP